MVNFFVKFLSEPTVVLGLVAMIGSYCNEKQTVNRDSGNDENNVGFSYLERRIKFDRICADTV
ncbi:hypothetical protein Rumi2_10090 [[Ruminococcus] torques]|nr:hypothetical protein Rumi2_10090 [[Ruminococcus] torques]